MYATDFWSLWDIGIVAVGVAFLITRQSTHKALGRCIIDFAQES